MILVTIVVTSYCHESLHGHLCSSHNVLFISILFTIEALLYLFPPVFEMFLRDVRSRPLSCSPRHVWRQYWPQHTVTASPRQMTHNSTQSRYGAKLEIQIPPGIFQLNIWVGKCSKFRHDKDDFTKTGTRQRKMFGILCRIILIIFVSFGWSVEREDADHWHLLCCRYFISWRHSLFYALTVTAPDIW